MEEFMKESKKYKIIEFIAITLWFIAVAISMMVFKSNEESEDVMIIITIVASVVLFPIAIYFENKAKKVEKEENRLQAIKEKEEAKKLLFERSQINNVINLMYELYFGNEPRINELLELYNLEMDYFYDEETKEDWFYIESKDCVNKSVDDIYLLELCSDGVITLGENEFSNISSKSYEEMVDIIVNNIKEFFKKYE
jgi:hypothetical protein